MRVKQATINDLKVIKELYWLLDTDAIHYQSEHFVRAERPDNFSGFGVNNRE